MEGGRLWVSAAKSSPYLADGGSQWVVKDTCQDKGPASTCSSKAHWMVSYSGVRSSQRTPKNRSLCLWNPDDSGCIPRGKKFIFFTVERNPRGSHQQGASILRSNAILRQHPRVFSKKSPFLDMSSVHSDQLPLMVGRIHHSGTIS